MTRQLVAAAAIANAVVAAVVAVLYGSSGLLTSLLGIVLAAAGVVAAYAVGERVAGGPFAAAAAIAYVVLPPAAILYFYGSYRTTYTHDVLPTWLGVEQPGLLALGVAIAIVARLAPRAAVAAAGAAAAIVAVIVWGIHALSPLDGAFHETAWSPALTEWLPIAGIAGAARRSPWLAAGLAGWLSFFVLRAAHADYQTGAFWRDLTPTLPAAAVILSAIALLVPRLRPAPEPKPAPRDAP